MHVGTILTLLVMNSRSNHTFEIEFDRLPVTIGRDPANRLRLQDPGVSRIHAVLEWTEPRLVLCDLGSRNGTFFRGIALRKNEPLEIDVDPAAFSVGPFHIIAKRERVHVESIDGATRRVTEDDLRLVARQQDSEAPATRRMSHGELEQLLRDEDPPTLVRRVS
jgi:pSer/pThr/pTyr-binding forkhead associated (FHA) protein